MCVYTHIYTYTYIYVHICLYIHMYRYIYIFSFRLFSLISYYKILNIVPCAIE